MAEEPKTRALLNPSVKVAKSRREKTNLPGFLERLKPKTPNWLREAMAEIMGTFILMVFGIGAMAQIILSKGEAGTYFTKNIATGMALAMAIYWAGSVSGGHVNPAFTIALASVQRFPLWKVPIYVVSQLLGAFLSAAVVYAIYHDGIQEYDGGIRQVLGPNGTAGIFTTFPKEFVSNMTGFWDQFFGTAMLVALIFPVLDKKNNSRPSPGLAPLIIGFILFLIGMTFGFNCGYPLNPAADLGPRIFISIAGWGGEVFTAHGHWAWIPLVACTLGGITGAYLYILTVEIHRHEQESVDENYDGNSNEKIRMGDSQA